MPIQGGIVSGRGIERLCPENVVCIALPADIRPHFATIANFISTMDNESAKMSSSRGGIQGYNGIAAVDEPGFESAQDHKKKRVENWKPVKGKKYFSADVFVAIPVYP